jgi:2-deoxy-D-gluconate 3-dehydrogenase
MGNLFDLTGRVALVTGGSRGIGRAIALGLAQAGAKVAVAARTKETLDAVVQEIGPDRGLAVVGDVSVLDDNRRMVAETVQRFGGLDIYVPVAGVNRRKPITEVEPEDYDFIVDTNLKGLYFGCQAAVKAMLPRNGKPNGKIITIGSLTTLQGVTVGLSVYAATKGGVGEMTKTIAIELMPQGIQANCIAPGWILTDLNRGAIGVEPRRSWVLSRTPAGRFGAPEDLAGTAVFLASSASDFVTGQVIAVDGGWLAGSDWAPQQ